MYLTGWVHNFVMQKMYGKLHDKELSANTSHANTCNRTLLCLHGTALRGSLTSSLRSSLAGFARHFYHKKAKQTPPEEGVGLLIQAECSIGVHVPGPRLGYCFQTMTLFRAALHASQKTGASALWCGSGMKGYVFLLFVKAQELNLFSSV